MAKRNKLFVWKEVLTDYTDGVMFALAPDVETAKKLIRADKPYIPDNEFSKEPEVIDTQTGYGFALYGGG